MEEMFDRSKRDPAVLFSFPKADSMTRNINSALEKWIEKWKEKKHR